MAHVQAGTVHMSHGSSPAAASESVAPTAKPLPSDCRHKGSNNNKNNNEEKSTECLGRPINIPATAFKNNNNKSLPPPLSSSPSSASLSQRRRNTLSSNTDFDKALPEIPALNSTSQKRDRKRQDSKVEQHTDMSACATDSLFSDPPTLPPLATLPSAPEHKHSAHMNESKPADIDTGTTGFSDSYKVYPADDERALPKFILECQTMNELDSVTGQWESALDEMVPDQCSEFWRSVIEDLEGVRRRAPLHLSAKVRAGIPPQVRGVVWQTLTQARSTYLQTLYTQLIQEYSPHERVIRRDLTRTFPKVPVFKSEGGEGQQRLFRILKAYSLYDAEVGYCQGLGFIIGPLIMSMGECEAFCVLVRLMETYDLRGMFTEDMAGLHLRLYQFQILAAEIVPEVMAHLEAHGVLPAMYAPSWFLSLFGYTMPLSFVLRAMDVVMAEGAPETIIRIGIALLQRNAEKLLDQEDFETAIFALNNELYDDEANVRDRPGYLLQEASRLSAIVTNQRLEELEVQYCKEEGVVLKGRQSMSAASTPTKTAVSANNPAIMKFLGWPWGSNSTTTAAIAPNSAEPTPNKWRLSSLGRSNTVVGVTPLSTKPLTDSQQFANDSGHISPRVLELTEIQKLHSQQLRELMLKSLQDQDNVPNTNLGISTQPLHEIKTRVSGESKTTTQSATLYDSDHEDSPRQQHSRISSSGSGSGNGWRDEILEPLQIQLHNARVTSDTHRDALVALQADHEGLREELAIVKTDRAGLAEENETLRMKLRKMVAECNRTQEIAKEGKERAEQSEDALIKARMELAEADEERALLVKQLSNLRKFIAESNPTSPVDANEQQNLPPATAPIEGPSTGNGNNKNQQSRFSISSIASNWSAFRGSTSNNNPPLTISTTLQDIAPSRTAIDKTAVSPPSTGQRRGSSANKSSPIPMASLHRSKTSPMFASRNTPPPQ